MFIVYYYYYYSDTIITINQKDLHRMQISGKDVDDEL